MTILLGVCVACLDGDNICVFSDYLRFGHFTFHRALHKDVALFNTAIVRQLIHEDNNESDLILRTTTTQLLGLQSREL